jgi:hypothetical protein
MVNLMICRISVKREMCGECSESRISVEIWRCGACSGCGIRVAR